MSLKICARVALLFCFLLPSTIMAQDFRTRNKMNREVDKHYNTNKLPGVVVMYAKDGKTSYVRSKGFANMEKGYAIDENKIMRHASVDKLIASVLAIKLEEKGKLDLNKKVRFYLPDLPAHHNYRVIDLLRCRSGVRHYGGTTSPKSPTNDWGDKQYATSYDAMKNFWHDPLVNNYRDYSYSTHGYTIAAAVMEKVTGKPISKIVKDELSNPYQLYTLAAEDKSVYRSARVRLYLLDDKQADRSQPTTRDNISWKVLGGGMESSPKDLMRFMVLLGQGKIISKTNVKRLMKRVEADKSYAIGCNHDIVNGVEVLGKSGGQRGASTYVWLAPKTQQAMVVMINRKEGAGASTLAKRLRNIVMQSSSVNNNPDLIVSKFERTGTPYYKDGKIKIPVRMRIKNQGDGPTFKGASNGFVQDKFVNAVRVGQKYYWSSFQGSMTGGEETGWVKATISIPDPNKLRAGRSIRLEAMADAPVAAADTSVNQQYARVKESNDNNNSKFLLVKIPGPDLGGFKGQKPNNGNQSKSPTRRPIRVSGGKKKTQQKTPPATTRPTTPKRRFGNRRIK